MSGLKVAEVVRAPMMLGDDVINMYLCRYLLR